MADRFPLILNTSNNQIQEIASGDQLDLSGNNIANAGIITAGNVTIGAATTDLIVTGDARVTGILTIGTSSLKLDGPNNLVNVGTALTLGHTQGLQFHTQNLHSAGFEVNQINVSGITTIGGKLDTNGVIEAIAGENKIPFLYADLASLPSASTYHGMFAHVHATGRGYYAHGGAWYELVNKDTNGNVALNKDLDVDGHTNLDNISVAGVSTFTGNTDFGAGIDVTGNATVSGNLSVGGVLTYEDVTNVDSVGIITARSSIKLDADGSASSNFLSIGADDDLKIFHQSNVDKIESSANGFHIRQINNGDLHIHAGANTGSANNRLVARAGGKAELYYAGNLKLSTETGGVNITGVCTATTFSGSGASLTNLNGSNIASGTVPVARIGTGTKNTSTFYRGDGTFATVPAPAITAINSASNNRVVTSDGGTTVTAESGLTFDGSRLATQALTIDDNGVSGVLLDVRADDQAPWMLHFGNDTYHADGGLWAYQSNSGAFEIRARGNNEYINLDFNRWNGSTNQNLLRLNANGRVELSYSGSTKLATLTTGIEIYGGSAAWSETNPGPNKGSIHLDPNDTTNHFGSAITFGASDHNNGQSAQAGIYTRSDGSYGTQMYFATTSSYSGGSYARFMIDYNGHVLPTLNGNYDLGASGKRWRNIYTSDLQLSNEGKTNDVDNTWGNYTIQEGESDLFLINNRNGKKYKFNLTEVS